MGQRESMGGQTGPGASRDGKKTIKKTSWEDNMRSWKMVGTMVGQVAMPLGPI